jgi:hypothetical protein
MGKRRSIYTILACFLGGFALTVALYFALVVAASHLSL